jgi:hypothetical protein
MKLGYPKINSIQISHHSFKLLSFRTQSQHLRCGFRPRRTAPNDTLGPPQKSHPFTCVLGVNAILRPSPFRWGKSPFFSIQETQSPTTDWIDNLDRPAFNSNLVVTLHIPAWRRLQTPPLNSHHSTPSDQAQLGKKPLNSSFGYFS